LRLIFRNAAERESLLMELESLKLSARRLSLSKKASLTECLHYQKRTQQATEEISLLQSAKETLERSLREEKQRRALSDEYDILAKEILSLPQKEALQLYCPFHSLLSFSELEETEAEIRKQEGFYSEIQNVLEDRASQALSLLDALRSLQVSPPSTI